MAKMIKCPTCATPIEINPQALGQVVKCPGCGKGIKLVAKKSSSPPGTSAAGYSAAMNSGSMMGETARSFMGEPALRDEPPKLDSTCPRCGRFTDEADLVEDEGEMICKECAIASAAERSGGAMEEYAPAPYIPSRRGKLINLTPMFFAFCFFALVLGGSQIYLNMVPVPKASKSVAQGSVVHTHTAPPPAPAPSPSTQPEATPPDVEKAPPAETDEDKADAQWEQANKDEILQRFNKALDALNKGNKDDAENLYKDAFGFIGGHKLKDPTLNTTVATAAKLWQSLHTAPAPTTAPETTASAPQPASQPAPEATAVNPAPTPANPLAQGLEALKQKDYNNAARIFEEQRLKLMRPPIPATLSNEQILTLVGKAAADLGRGRIEEARYTIDFVYQKGARSRAVLLNRGLIYLATPHVPLRDLSDVTRSIRDGVLASNGNDEVAADIFGSLLNRASSTQMSPENRQNLDAQQKFLDDYNAQLASQHPGKLKWGMDWLPEEDVKRYRMLKGSVQDTALAQLYRELDMAKARAAIAQKSFDQASHAGTNTSQLKTQLDEANAKVDKVQKDIENAKQAVQPQRWIEKFDPIIPDEPQS